MKKPPYTHSICKECWNARNPYKPITGTPSISEQEEQCCFCGTLHRTGLYVRHDQPLSCENVKGIHELGS